MGSKGRMSPPSHLRRPLPGPDMLHPDPFRPGVHPQPGAFPFDMLPHPEIMEQKFVAQDLEMRKLLRENQRLAATHSVLRQELAAAQQELQRLHAHMGAMKDDQEQHMRGLLDKMTKMEADLKASETVKVELQKAHAQAQSLMTARQELMVKVQQLNQDLQRNHADVQQVPALMSELDNLRQEYQHCRANYDYERKLGIDHYESLQVMEKNYMSMVREVEKLRAELTNANIDRSGGSYSNSGGYKESDTTGQRSVGQNVYEDVYAGPQGRGPSGGGAVTYGGGPAGTAPTRPGYDAPVRGGPVYDALRNPGYDASRVAAGYDNSRGGSFEPPKAAAAASYEVPRGGQGYDAASKGAGGAQVPPAAGNAPGTYGSAQTTSPYGSAQAPSSYGPPQAPSPYGSAQAPNPFGSAQVPNPYGSAQAPNPYGSAQAHNPYASAQAPNPYASAQTPPVGGAGYDAPPRGGAGGGGTASSNTRR